MYIFVTSPFFRLINVTCFNKAFHFHFHSLTDHFSRQPHFTDHGESKTSLKLFVSCGVFNDQFPVTDQFPFLGRYCELRKLFLLLEFMA